MKTTSEKKILFLVQLPPPVHGASVMNNFIKESQEINSSFNTQFINISTARDIADIGKGGIKKIFKVIILFFKILKCILVFSPDVVYITLSPVGSAFLKDSLLLMPAKFARKRIVLHLHGKGIFKNMKGWFSRSYYNFIFRNTHVIHLSDILLPDLNKIENIRRTYIVPNGIGNKISATKKHEFFNVVYLSNMVESKGALLLLQAAKEIKNRKLKNVRFHFAGQWYEPGFKDKFQKYFDDNQMESYCKYHGAVYGTEKEEFFSRADLFVFPSDYPNECFPLVLLEAMSYGLPIISTRNGAIPEIVKDGINGFILNKKDTVELSDRIEQLFKDEKLCQKISNSNQKQYLEKYTIDKFESTLTNTLKEISD